MRCRKGLLTEVGERGAGLSVGQRQLVCFTRALLADPRLVILDEATSSIDALTEARLQKALVDAAARPHELRRRAPALSTIRHADLVLVLDQGRVIERGTHAELLGAADTTRRFTANSCKSMSAREVPRPLERKILLGKCPNLPLEVPCFRGKAS
jgi:ABC-type multidrug transport system fused ATPase/permease subunit